MFKIVSFRRSGYNYLAQLLFSNFATGAKTYEEFHYSHSEISADRYICVYRHLLPTMVSYYKMRERFGIHRDVSFQDFIRQPYNKLPHSGSCDVRYNGERVVLSHRAHYLCERDALPVIWLDFTRRAFKHAFIAISYDTLVARPLLVLDTVSDMYSVDRLPFSPIESRVGWVPADESVHIEPADIAYLEMTERQLTLERAKPCTL